MRQHRVVKCVPDRVDVACTDTKEHYTEFFSSTIEKNRAATCYGKTTGEPLPSQMIGLIKVLNPLGLYSQKQARLLTSSSLLIREEIKLANRPKEIRNIIKNLHTRSAARNAKLVCALSTILEAQQRHLNELTTHIYGKYSCNWH